VNEKRRNQNNLTLRKEAGKRDIETKFGPTDTSQTKRVSNAQLALVGGGAQYAC
jgi:CobQ-like glutamine amidotransferase family enzyme